MADTLQVVKRTAGNRHRAWAYSDTSQTNAANRLAAGGPVNVGFDPGFTLCPGDRVFTMGSCFARNVERKLSRLGLRILTEDLVIPAAYYRHEPRNGRGHRGVLNKYNTHSMLTEVRRALGQLPALPDDGFIELGKDRWIDPQASSLAPAPLTHIRAVRDAIDTTHAALQTANVAFFTLGLTETWFDDHTGLSLNQPPTLQVVRRTPGRYRFHNAGFDDVVANLTEMIDLVARHSTVDRVVLTVSPVPLTATFTGGDVISANALSKATLLCAARAVAARHAQVDYFPSYEMVTSSPRALAFAPDGVHVQSDMVKFVTDRFADGYVHQSARHRKRLA